MVRQLAECHQRGSLSANGSQVEGPTVTPAPLEYDVPGWYNCACETHEYDTAQLRLFLAPRGAMCSPRTGLTTVAGNPRRGSIQRPMRSDDANRTSRNRRTPIEASGSRKERLISLIRGLWTWLSSSKPQEGEVTGVGRTAPKGKALLT